MIPTIYIAGKYTADCAYKTKLNIQAAELLGMQVAKLGGVPLIPHTNTAHWEGIQSDEWFYEATMSLLAQCDAMIFIDGHEEVSYGTKKEIEHCNEVDKPCFRGDMQGLKELEKWLKSHTTTA